MPAFLTQVRFTEKGLKAAAKSPERAAAFRKAVEKAKGKLVAQYWALGDVDGVMVFEAPDDATAAGLLLELGAKGFVRTSTTRLLDAAEYARASAGLG